MMSVRRQQSLAAQIHLDRPLAQVLALLAEINANDMPGHELRSEARGLLPHVVDEFGPLNPFGKAGEILHQCSDGELAAGFVAFDDQGTKIGARRVNRCGQPGTAGADDNHITNICRHRIRFDSPTRRKMQPARRHAGSPVSASFSGI